jgi:hypothetical protein
MSDEEWGDEQAVMEIEEYLKEVGSFEMPNATFVAVYTQIKEMVEWATQFYVVRELVVHMNECAEVWSTAEIWHQMHKDQAQQLFQTLLVVIESLLTAPRLRKDPCALYLKALLQFVLNQLQARTDNHNWFQFVISRLEEYGYKPPPFQPRTVQPKTTGVGRPEHAQLTCRHAAIASLLSKLEELRA